MAGGSSTSNTFVLPSQGASIAISRTQFNSSLRSLLQNFYSTSKPDADNVIDAGAAIPASEYDGMLYRESREGILYISDSAITTNSGKTLRPIGGNFTRHGIAWRVQRSLAQMAANLGNLDIGEAFVVINSENASNNRMYLRVGTSTSFSDDILDVGTPPPGATISASGIITVSGEELAAISLETTDTVKKVLMLQEADISGATFRYEDQSLATINVRTVNVPEISNTYDSPLAELVPTGMVMAWAGISPTVPDGWLLCDGSQISKTTYSHLYDTIGAGYGTVNSTTFALPDLSGRAIYGIYTTNSLNMGWYSAARLQANFKTTTSSGGPTTHSATTVAYQYPSIPKDAPSYNLSTAVSDHVAHTHDVTHPAVIMRYVIRA